MHDTTNDRPLLTTRAAEFLVSGVLIFFCGIAAWGSWQLGAGWGDIGPESGSFPFYTSMIVIVCSVLVMFFAMRDKKAAAETFVTVEQFKLVLKVLIPTIIYVSTIGFIGIYVASTVFIAFFMIWIGKYGIAKAAAVGFGVSAAAYSLFEIWFHVPLPKGPLEAVLGLN